MLPRKRSKPIRRHASTNPAKTVTVFRPPVTINDAKMKEEIYGLMARLIREKVGGRPVGREFCKVLFEEVAELIFSYAIHSGMFRFPRGLGTLVLKKLAPTSKRLPSGEVMKLDNDRSILRYREGLAVRVALGKPDKYPGRLEPVRATLTDPRIPVD